MAGWVWIIISVKLQVGGDQKKETIQVQRVQLDATQLCLELHLELHESCL